MLGWASSLSGYALVGGHGLDDIGVSGVGDGHDGHAEVAAAGGTQVDVVAAVVVHAGLGKHGVVLQLRLPHGGDVVGHNEQLGCKEQAGAQAHRVWLVCAGMVVGGRKQPSGTHAVT